MQNRVYRWGVWLLLSCFYLGAAAEKLSYIYRLQLSDKNGTPYSIDKPEQFLSDRAIARRTKQELLIEETDLPVTPHYIKGIEEHGVEVIQTSKWNNTVLVKLSDTLLTEKINSLPYVNSMKKVWTSPMTEPTLPMNRQEGVTNEVKRYKSFYGAGQNQVTMHNGEQLHEAGYWGEGMHIAVIDAGFYNADIIKAFKSMDLLGIRDFVNPQSDIYAENYHGMKVLSCLASYLPNSMVGTAPKASYWLLRSEDEISEQLVEEDYWVAAIEFADSVGVDVVNTSLGYYDFDNGFGNYRYRDLDGHTSLMSNTASMMAGKGMVLVCSAGNTGSKAWKKITPPADAKDVLSVGAINKMEVNADFSSIGDTSDGRIKPDVMAVGFSTSIIGNNGGLSQANGTSFASPVICGLVACFWQACPWLTATEVIAYVRQAGDRASYPNNIFGYGIPNIWSAYQEAVKMKYNAEVVIETPKQNH
ncbi:MAG: S8 family peptidase [Phocaeicola sp.]